MLCECEGAMACYMNVREQWHAICYCEGAMACYMNVREQWHAI